MGYVLAYIQGITADEEADDTFCQRMVESCENDPDPGEIEALLEGRKDREENGTIPHDAIKWD